MSNEAAFDETMHTFNQIKIISTLMEREHWGTQGTDENLVVMANSEIINVVNIDYIMYFYFTIHQYTLIEQIANC